MSEKVAVTKSKLVDVADAIREKAEIEDGLGLDEMPEAIRGIQTGAGFTISNASYLFYNGSRLDKYAELASLLGDVTDMSYMFYQCNDNNIDFNILNTRNVKSMNGMFKGFVSGTSELDLSGFNTTNVTNMSSMFTGCKNSRLNLSSFNTSNVTDMSSMFSSCSNLETLNLSSFNTPKLTTMESMFVACMNLQSLNIENFNTEKVTNMMSTFANTKLSEVNLSNFDTSSVTTMNSMFQNSKYLTTLNLSSFNTAKVTNMSLMFNGCKSLEEIIGFSATNKAGLSIGFPNGSASAPNALKRLTFRTDLPEGTYAIRSAINVSYCAFDRTGMVEMFNSLPNITSISVSTSYKKITITGNPCVVDGTLTEEDKAIATAKGWTLVI